MKYGILAENYTLEGTYLPDGGYEVTEDEIRRIHPGIYVNSGTSNNNDPSVNGGTTNDSLGSY